VSEVRGDFIARMDADSIAAPRRLERQLDAFTRRPEIGVVGTEVELIDPRGRHTVKPRPVRCVEPGGARFMGLFANPLAHVTIMARSTVLKTHPYGGTPESVHTEDYELFTRLLEAGVAFLNLREPLVTVVDRPEGTSWTHENVQVANFVASARRHLSRSLEIEAPAGAHKVLVNRLDASITAHDLDAGLRLLDLIEGIYLEREPDAAGEISRIADMQRLDVLVQAARRGSMPVRVAAGGLALRYHRSVTSPFGMRHLASKRPRAALARRA
jgi:cellulose synthase/poly-beta-1,6-N-acetylglucosamine synthase-like glycosyltransferase